MNWLLTHRDMLLPQEVPGHKNASVCPKMFSTAYEVKQPSGEHASLRLIWESHCILSIRSNRPIGSRLGIPLDSRDFPGKDNVNCPSHAVIPRTCIRSNASLQCLLKCSTARFATFCLSSHLCMLACKHSLPHLPWDPSLSRHNFAFSQASAISARDRTWGAQIRSGETTIETRNSTNCKKMSFRGFWRVQQIRKSKCWGEQTRCFPCSVGNPLLLWLVQFWRFRCKLSSLQVVQALQSPSSQSCKPKSPEWVWLYRFPAPLDSPVGRPAWEQGNVAGCTGLTWLNIKDIEQFWCGLQAASLFISRGTFTLTAWYRPSHTDHKLSRREQSI